METDTDKLIQDRWESLPLDVKQALTNIPWKQRVRDIAKREQLDESKSDGLETELLLVLYGFVPADTLTGNLIAELGIEEEQAERIVKTIENQIIVDIEKQLEMIDALTPEASSSPIPNAPIHQHTNEAAPVTVLNEEPIAHPLPEVPPEILPETVPGEVTHDSAPANSATPSPVIAAEGPAIVVGVPTQPLPPTEQQPTEAVAAPAEPEKKAGYPGGIDPYREPIE